MPQQTRFYLMYKLKKRRINYHNTVLLHGQHTVLLARWQWWQWRQWGDGFVFRTGRQGKQTLDAAAGRLIGCVISSVVCIRRSGGGVVGGKRGLSVLTLTLCMGLKDSIPNRECELRMDGETTQENRHAKCTHRDPQFVVFLLVVHQHLQCLGVRSPQTACFL